MPSTSEPKSVQTRPAIGERGMVDIHMPEGGMRAGCVLAIHGGGWNNGDRTSLAWVAHRLVPHGIAVVTCSYRVAKDGTFPAGYDDLVELLKWWRREGASHGLPERCTLLGSSAGGHLVCLLATRGLLEHGSLMPGIDAVVAYCPPIDLVLQFEHDELHDSRMTQTWIGGTPAQKPHAYRDGSPLHFVHPDMPPLWLAHGDKDAVVPFAQSGLLIERMRATNLPYEFHVASGCGHTMVEGSSEPYVLLEEQRVVSFIKRHSRAGR